MGKRLGGAGQDFSLGGCDDSTTPGSAYLVIGSNYILANPTTTAAVAMVAQSTTANDPSSSGTNPGLTIYFRELVLAPNPCMREMSTWVDPSAINYNVNAAALVTTLTPPDYFEATEVCDPYDLLWTFTVVPTLTVTSSSVPIAFDPATFAFTVYTTDPAHIGSYSVTITTTAPTVSVHPQTDESTAPFTVTILAELAPPPPVLPPTIDTTTEADSTDFDLESMDEAQAIALTWRDHEITAALRY